MSLRVFSSAFITLTAMLMISTAQAQPQNRNQAMQQQRMQQMQPTKTAGTLVAATSGQIQLLNDAKQTIYVVIQPDAQVNVTGTAESEYLKPGVVVEFLAEVAKGGAVKEKIAQMKIVSPTADQPIGLFPEETGTLEKKGEKGGKADDEKASLPALDAGLGDSTTAKGRKSAKSDSDPSGGKSAKSSSVPKFPGNFTVRGTIKMSKNGSITVGPGRGPTIKADLADDIKIEVDVADVRVAQPDDKVTVSGFASPVRPNMVMAQTVKIELANPLSGPKKRATRPVKTPAADKAKKGTVEGDDVLGGGK